MGQGKINELKKLWLFGVQLSKLIKKENEDFLKLSPKELQEMVLNNACICDLHYDGHITESDNEEMFAEKQIKLAYKQIKEKNSGTEKNK